jgi:hypothetical protein
MTTHMGFRRVHPCRLDVLYGYRTIRPQLAARIHADG